MDSEVETDSVMATADEATKDLETLSQVTQVNGKPISVSDANSFGIGFSQFPSDEGTFEASQVLDSAFNSQTFSSDEIGFKVSTANTLQFQRFPLDENTKVSSDGAVEARALETHPLEEMKQKVVDAKESEEDLKVFSVDEITLEEPEKVQDNGFKGMKDKNIDITTANVSSKG